MTWQESARTLGHHPTELAFAISLLLSLGMTAVIRAGEFARPRVKAFWERRPYFKGERSDLLYNRLDEAAILLLLSLLAVFGGGSLFLHLVEGVLENSWLPQWDALFVQTVHETVSQVEVAFFSAITPLAGRYPPYILGLVVGLVLWKKGHFRLLALWVGGLVGNGLLIGVLKYLFSRARPVLDNPYLVEDNYSFPSGHAMTSILLYGLLAYVCSREFFKYQAGHRYLMIWMLSFLGVLIGTSRLVLGVHYPSDVAAGWSLAVVWLAVLVLAGEAMRGRFGAWSDWRWRRATQSPPG